MPANPTAANDSGSRADHAAHATVIASGTIRLPIHFFVLSVFWFVYGSIELPWIAPKAIRLFYQPTVLSLVHVFTLGFITSAIMGVMYRYVPALTHRSIPYPRLAMVQFAAYVIGVAGMVSHFALDQWSGLWWSAAMVLASIILFAIDLIPLLWTGFGNGIAETGMFGAICFLLVAAALGLLMGLEEVHGFLWGNLVASLGGHATFAAIGWMTLTICAAAYRFVPAFILPKKQLPPFALWQIVALAIATLGLGTSILFGLDQTLLWSLLIAGALLAWMIIMITLIRSRRMPIEWSSGHALAGMLWLIVAIVLGQLVAWSGAWSARGSRFAGAMATAAILGWAGNFIIGMSYQLFPGFVARVRTAMRFPLLSIAELSIQWPRPLILFAYNAGVISITSAFIIKAPALGAAGGSLVIVAAVPYAAITLWTLSYAYRRSVLRTARNGFPIPHE